MNKQKLLPLILALIIMAAAGYFKSGSVDTDNGTVNTDSPISVRYIDVGQGDCELITFPDGRNMLIDAGTTAVEKELPQYLGSIGVTRLDYVIATHPHEDHIGGLDAVINSLDIGQIYMPKASANTKTYKDVLTAAKNKGLSINTAKAGKIIINENNIKAEFLAPVKDEYESLNNYSAVLRLQFGNTSFLFTGDAETLAENEILSVYSADELKSDVLKAGHHGSSTSSSKKFLNAVAPSFAVITCGADNSYGHPHRETLDDFGKRGIKIYRTDLNGTITAVSDGNNIVFTSEK